MTSTSVAQTAKKLPSVSTLISETVSLYKKTAWPFMKLALLQLVTGAVILFVVVLLFIAVATVTGFANLDTLGQVDPSLLLDSSTNLMAAIGGFLFLFIGLLIALLTFGPAFQASLMLQVGKYNGSAKTLAVFKEGFTFTWPVLLCSVLYSFLVLGSFGLLVIPGLVIAHLLSFALYEVVLEKKSALAGIKGSQALVRPYFWAVLWRVALFAIGSYVFFAVLAGLRQSLGNSALALVVGAVEFLVTLVSLPLSMVFGTVLFRQLKAVDRKRSLGASWIWIVGGLGWILFVLLWFIIGSAIFSGFQA